MNLQPQEKKALAIFAAAATAMVAVIAVATFLLVRGHHDDSSPTLSITAKHANSQIAPVYWCEVNFTECTPFDPKPMAEIPIDPAQFPTAPGQTVWLTVPAEVAEGPWVLTAQYATPRGLQAEQWFHASGTTFTQGIKTTPDRVLLGIELAAIGGDTASADALEAGQGVVGPRALYSVQTTPEGFVIPNQALLPAIEGKS